MSMPAEHVTPILTLADLLEGYADAPPIPIHGIASDSRLLAEGFLFLACQGVNSHGLDHLAEAQAAGASAVAYDASTIAMPRNIGVPIVAVDDLGTQAVGSAGGDRRYRNERQNDGRMARRAISSTVG
jgi:UDP-N-acetylmuramoyl-L-alanyl-D-glutamate--2,6-diaminopimelate ligase